MRYLMSRDDILRLITELIDARDSGHLSDQMFAHEVTHAWQLNGLILRDD